MSESTTSHTHFHSMTDSQLHQAINQLSAAGKVQQTTGQVAHPGKSASVLLVLQELNKIVLIAYFNNIRQWSTSVTPPPTNGRTNPIRTRSRLARGSSLAPAPPQPTASTSTQQPIPPPAQSAPTPVPPLIPEYPTAHRRVHIPPTTQAYHSTYASRLRTGTTLLMQPILTSSSTAAVNTRSTRRGGVVNYADPGSGDEFPDAGALDSDDSDFIASGGTRSAMRAARLSSKAPIGAGVFHAGGTMTPTTPLRPPTPQHQKTELEQSYLGMIPPSRFIVAKPVGITRQEYYPPEALDSQARRPVALVPIRVEFETDTHRIRDCFVWNLNENLIQPESFARTFCTDLDIPFTPWVETIANQIRAQLEDHEGIASMDLFADNQMNVDETGGEETLECRVILSIDVQIATHHLTDHIEWDLLSPLTPEAFATTLCAELGLAGEAIPLVAHAVHEELVKHKRDAIEWGVIGDPHQQTEEQPDKPRDKSGLSLMKDKTGLGLGWGRAPKDGRGPKPLRSIWRDWPEAEEFRTRFEVLTAEEVEKREIERERASRRLRRETSKFQSQASQRRRR